MKRPRRMTGLLSLTAILVLVSLPVYSQTEQKGEIEGIVQDESAAVLPGVSITLTGEKLFQKSLVRVSNEKGAFRFINLNPGEYELEFTIRGFNTLKLTRVSVEVGRSTAVIAKMKPESISQEVMVIAEAPLIETKTAQRAVNIDSTLVQSTPVPRSLSTITSLMNVMPGVNDNAAYGSSGTVESSDLSYGSIENGYRFNGLDVSNPRVGYTSLNPIYETIEEFQLVGIGATAEYGDYVGGSFNIITKSGTNNLHGSLTGLFSNDTFRSNNNPEGLAQLQPQLFKYDMEVSATLSGPLIKEKLFFFLGGGFAAYEKKWPIFTEYQTSTRPRVYAKLDWLINPKNTVSMMFNANPCFIKNTGLMAGWADTTAADYDLSVMNTLFLTWQSIFSEKTYLNFKVAGWKEDYNYYAAYPGVPFYMKLETSEYFGSYLQDQRIPSSSIESNATLTHYAENLFGASHELKLGAEYSHQQVTDDFVYNGGGYFLSIPSGDTTIWQAFTGGNTHTQGRIDRLTGFAQDNLKIGGKLGLNLGLRFEDIRVTARDFSGDVAHFTTLSPRVGLTYDISGDAKNVIRASFGQYYNKVLTTTFSACMPGNDDSYTYMLVLPQGEISTSDQSLKDQLALIAQPENLISTTYRAVPMAVDPDMRLPRANIFDIGFSRKLSRDFVFELDYMYKTDRNRLTNKSLAEHTYVEFQWTEPTLGKTVTLWQQTDANPDTDRMLANSAWEKRRHHFLMFVLRKQPTHRWMMMFSYVFQNTKSNTNGASDLFGYGGWNYDTDPFYYANPLQWGEEGDRPHQFKLLTTIFGPWGINVSGNLQALSGTPWEAYISGSYVTGPDVPAGPSGNRLYRSVGSLSYVYLEPKGSRRAPFNWNFDIRLAKAFKIRKGELEFRIDIFNLFNNAYTETLMGNVNIRYSQTGESAFGKAWRLDPPRNIYLGFTWRF